jgi:predicted chitinase
MPDDVEDPAAAQVPSSAVFKAALQKILPKVDAELWTPLLFKAFAQYELNTPRRIAAAIGQFSVEAGDDFGELVENLNYSTPERLHKIFPTAFPTVDSAKPYLHDPEKLANLVYANRLGNGDEASGDGWKFCGRGLIQLTGRNEYAEFGKTIGKTVDEVSAYSETAEGAAMGGCWYLSSRNCLTLADGWQITKITRAVNGKAMVDKELRLSRANAFRKAFGES